MSALTDACHPFPPFGGLAVADRQRAVARELGPACVPQLEAVVDGGNTPMRVFAIEMLAELAPGRFEARALDLIAKDADPEVTAAAVRALGHASSSSSLQLLMDRLAGDRLSLCEAAVVALSRRTDEGLAPSLIAMVNSTAPKDTRRAALRVLIARSEADDVEGALARERLHRAVSAHDAAMEDLFRYDAPGAELSWLALERGSARMQVHAVSTLIALGHERDPRLRLVLERQPHGAGTTNIDVGRTIQEIAARALTRDPTEAFAFLAPMIDPAHFGDTQLLERAEWVTFAVYEMLVKASDVDTPRDKVVLPAPQWREAYERVAGDRATSAPLRELAGSILRAFRWLDGERDPLAESYVELGEGDDAPFPFFVLGWWWEGERPCDDDALESSLGAGLIRFQHQTGGYSVRQVDVLGIPLGMPTATRERAESFAATFETWGDPLDREALSYWSKLAAESGLPPLTSGHEAIAATEPLTDGGHAAIGLERLRFRARCEGWRGVHYFRGTPVIESLGPLRFEDLVAVANVAASAPSLGKPRLVLLWGNSD